MLERENLGPSSSAGQHTNSDAPKTPIANDDLFHHLVDTVRDYAIYLHDVRGRVVSWNSDAKGIHGYAASEAGSRPSTRRTAHRTRWPSGRSR